MTRPPFAPGNRLALVHGATSPRAVAPLAQQIEVEARRDASWPAYLDDPAYGHAVAAWARAEAVVQLLWVYLAERDLAAALDAVTTEESEEQRSKGRTTRSSTSRRTTAALAAWEKAESAAAGHRQRLGLDPMSRAKLGKDVAATAVQAGLAQLQHDGAELVAKARASGALADGATGGAAVVTTSVDGALAVLASLRLEDGRAWGEAATAHQWADATAVLDQAGPRRHWLGRSRGYSKTTDVAGLATAILLAQLAPGSRVYAAAADKDQAGLLLNAIAGFVARTPELRGQLTVQAGRVIADRTGSVLEVLAADAASSYGLLPAALVVDELCQWPGTRNAREFYAALTSALPKVPGSRLVIMSTAGDPAHWSKKVYDQAGRSSMWRVSDVHGPAPWQDAAEVDEQRTSLMPSVYARLFENQWSASEDRLVDPEDLDVAMCLRGDVAPVAGVRYVVSLDLGLKNDATVAVVAHRERVDDGDRGSSRVVVDRLRRWRGSRAEPLEIGLVEAEIIALSELYNRAAVVADPWQSVGLLQRLRARGVTAEEFAFTSQSVGRLAHAVYGLLRGHRLHLPDDEVLRDELLSVRLRETNPGTYRLDHDAGRHDDQAVAIALAAQHLLSVADRPAPRMRWLTT